MPKQSVTNKSKKSQGSKINISLVLILYSFAIQSAVFIASCILSLILGVKQPDYYIVSLVALALGSAVSGFISGKKRREKGMLFGTLYALPSNLIYILISVVLNGFKIDYNLFLSFALLVACSAAGGVVSVNTRSKAKIKTKRTKR